jgi:hypothetical protein
MRPADAGSNDAGTKGPCFPVRSAQLSLSLSLSHSRGAVHVGTFKPVDAGPPATPFNRKAAQCAHAGSPPFHSPYLSITGSARPHGWLLHGVSVPSRPAPTVLRPRY